MKRRAPRALLLTAATALVLGVATAAAGCGSSDDDGMVATEPPVGPLGAVGDLGPDDLPWEQTGGDVTLAFAGDTHFEAHLENYLDSPEEGLGEFARPLAEADFSVVNLESAIAEPGSRRDPKEREDPDERYWFRTSPAALDVLAASGVDAVSMANNHGADYGAAGIEQTLAAAEDAPLGVVGIGEDRADAFTPYDVTVNSTDIALLAGDASFREGASAAWGAGPDNPGLASAHTPAERADLLRAVAAADATADVVVVYVHWGEEQARCPSGHQRELARRLSEAGADVIVGSHPHVLQGSGWLGDTYVSYSLGNFLWYHGAVPQTGVLQLRVSGGRVVEDAWVPGRILDVGGVRPLGGVIADGAVEDWEALRDCAGLAETPATAEDEEEAAPVLEPYESSVGPVTPETALRASSSHGPGCPVPWTELRHLRMSYVGFDGRAHTGEMIVHADHAEAVTRVFERLYDARFPINSMRLVSDFGGDDEASMAANNTSAFNCRRVAGSSSWSAHAYGRAIDINPLQNPYLHGGAIDPPAGRDFAHVDRGTGATADPGVIREGDVVVRAFAEIGWEWGGLWGEPDYQHFSAGG